MARIPTRRLQVFGIVLLAGLAGPAPGRAEEILVPERRSAPATPEAIEASPLTARGVWSGKLAFFPKFDYGLTYTDNSLRTEGHRRQDALQEYTPAFILQFDPGEDFSLNADYSFGWHDYLENTARDYLSHGAKVEIRSRRFLLDGAELAVGDAYTQTGNSSALENEILAFSRYEKNGAWIKGIYDYRLFRFMARYTYGWLDYFSRSNSAGSFHDHSGVFAAEYAWLPERMSAFGSYEIVRTLRDDFDDDDFDAHKALFGVKGTYGKLRYDVGAGYTIADLLNRTGGDEGPAFLAALSYSPHRRVELALNASRTFSAGVLAAFSTETDLGFSAQVAVTDRGAVRFGFTRNESDRVAGEDLVSTEYSLGYEHKFTRHVSASARIARTERTTDSGAGDFRIHEAGVGLRLAW